MKRIRHAIRAAEGEGRSWHAVIDQVRFQGGEVWRALPLAAPVLYFAAIRPQLLGWGASGQERRQSPIEQGQQVVLQHVEVIVVRVPVGVVDRHATDTCFDEPAGHQT